jgi:acyl phosphate:glycerol-3-phosphate acyltransferase
VSFIWVLVPLAYAVGTFPTAHLVGHFVGHDPTSEGSGNPGASNMMRVAGKWAGFNVLLGDLAKAIVPSTIGWLADGRPLGLACGAAAVVGHIFPVQRKFRGGKGVAAFGGMSLVFWPVPAVVAMLSWAAIVRFTKVASVGSIVATSAVIGGAVVLGRPWWEVAVAAGTGTLILVRHWSNLSRLVRNKEKSISRGQS